MIQDINRTKYFIYARKSSESDEKQVQSIEDQIFVLEAFRKTNNLLVVDILSEAKSAKEPHARPVFEDLLKRIKAGEATGIIVWKIDRLARNPIDGASIQWLLQKGVIKSIRTPDREYRPEDNVLILNVESSMAIQYILDLSKNVKRGLKSKIEKGWRPNRAPIGYLNTKTELRGENYIVTDSDRFPLLRQAWDLMLTGNHLPTQILAILNNEWGFRSRQTKKKGGLPLTRATIYRIFSNVFYTGLIDNNGVYVQGKHEPMITFDEYDRVQALLGRKGKPRYIHHKYSYTGLIKCGECHGTVSATNKQKLIVKTGKLKQYSLYYCNCARKKKNDCQQKKYTNSELLDQAVEETIISFTIHPKFKDWVFNIIDDLKDTQEVSESKIIDTQQEALKQSSKQLETLTQLRLREMIDDEEYVKEKVRLKNEITILENKIATSQTFQKDYIKLTRHAFEFAFYALKQFQSGPEQIKREILAAISGLNCTLKDKKLFIPKAKWLISIQERYKVIEDKYKEVELKKSHTPYSENDLFEMLCIELRGLVDVVRTNWKEYPENYSIPLLHKNNPP